MTDNEQNTRDRVFRFIVAFKRDHDGLTPTAKEIADALLIGESTVKYHWLKLENEKRIKVSRRGIEVTGGAWDFSDDEEA